MIILSTSPNESNPDQLSLFIDEGRLFEEMVKDLRLAIKDYVAELDSWYASESRHSVLGKNRIKSLNDKIEDLESCRGILGPYYKHYLKTGEFDYASIDSNYKDVMIILKKQRIKNAQTFIEIKHYPRY